MFKASYDYGFEEEYNVLWLEDLNGEKSLTNDIENAITEIIFINNLYLSDLQNYKIMYKDSTGNWDGIKVEIKTAELFDAEISQIENVEFFPIQETDFEMALYRLLAYNK